MAKFCIFCGNTPDKKNKEHVIPQWLSKFTGKYHSVCRLGGVPQRDITFSALTFPACTACNEKFSILEAQSKSILTNIMESKPVTAWEINTLMDWFDKIRVGMWLGQLTLESKVDAVAPKFHIADRIGKKDRFLMIERIKTDGKGIALAGIDSPIFTDMPSAFQITINDFVFTNASEYGLVSEKLGFPKFNKIKFHDDNHEMLTIDKGRNKTKHPIIPMYTPANTCTLIYQPMYPGLQSIQPNNPFDVPYVQQHSLDAENGRGGIFLQKKDNTVRYLAPDQKINVTPKEFASGGLIECAMPTYELQGYIWEHLYDSKSAHPATQQFFQNAIAMNKWRIQNTMQAYGIKKR